MFAFELGLALNDAEIGERDTVVSGIGSGGQRVFSQDAGSECGGDPVMQAPSHFDVLHIIVDEITVAVSRP